MEINIKGPSGNAFALLGHVAQILRDSKHTKEEIKAVTDDMKSGDYEHLLDVAGEYLDIVGRD